MGHEAPQIPGAELTDQFADALAWDSQFHYDDQQIVDNVHPEVADFGLLEYDPNAANPWENCLFRPEETSTAAAGDRTELENAYQHAAGATDVQAELGDANQDAADHGNTELVGIHNLDTQHDPISAWESGFAEVEVALVGETQAPGQFEGERQDTTGDAHAGVVYLTEADDGANSESSWVLPDPEYDQGSAGIIDHLTDRATLQRAVQRKLKWGSLAQAKAAAAGIPAGYRAPADPSRPQSVEDQQVYVALLLDAIHDESAAEDNAPLRKQFSKKLKEIPYEIEASAWRLLDKVLNYHAIPGFLGTRAGGARASKHTRFSEHIDHLCTILRRQKTICQQLLQEEPVVSLVDDPDGQEKRVRNNRTVNKNKKEHAEQNSNAINELKDKRKNGEDVTETLDRIAQEATRPKRKRNDDENGDEEEAAPRRRKRGKVGQKRGPRTRSHANLSGQVPADGGN